MGFSVGNLLKSIGGSVVDALPGGSFVNSLIDLPGGGNNNNPYVPDIIEGIYNPAVNQPSNAGGCPDIPVVVQPGQTVRLKAPPGYVIVECNGRKVAMLKPVAKALGYWSPRKKPPISVKDWRCVMRAASTQKKLKRVVSVADKALGTKIVPRRSK